MQCIFVSFTDKDNHIKGDNLYMHDQHWGVCGNNHIVHWNTFLHILHILHFTHFCAPLCSSVHYSPSMSISSSQAYQELTIKCNLFCSCTKEIRSNPQSRKSKNLFFLLSSVLPPRLWWEYKTSKFFCVTPHGHSHGWKVGHEPIMCICIINNINN